MLYAAKASANLGLTAHASFSGALAWPYLYSWPPRPPGLIEEAFDELAKRWRPILDAFDGAGVDVCYEIHPGEDLHDGETYEMFLERVGNIRHMLVQASLRYQCAGQESRTDHSEWQQQKTAFDDKCRHGDDSDDQQEGDDSKRATLYRFRAVAVAIPLQRTDQMTDPTDGMTD